jgi:hypothetical protein
MKTLKAKLRHSFKNLKQSPRVNQKGILLFVAGFAIIGGIIIIASHAATQNGSVEPENGVGNAAIGTDANASGGSFVQFKSASGNNAANRFIMYTGCTSVIGASDAQLDTWKSRGVGGFVCTFSKLKGLGGTEDWTGDPNALATGAHGTQRSIRDTKIVDRLKARDMKVYMGLDVVDYYHNTSPFGGTGGWVDDTWWNNTVIPAVAGFAGAAHLYGFDGVFFDQEMIGCKSGLPGGGCGDWVWNYNGNTASEATVRAKAKQRGQQLMTAMLAQFPQMELTVYDNRFPEDANSLIQQVVNKVPDTQQYETVSADFWNGLTSVDGYKAIRFNDATFYKVAHIGGFDDLIPYDYNRTFAYASRTFDNWDYLAPRFFISPFIWISQNSGNPDSSPPNRGEPFSYYRGDQYVYNQMQTFRKWGMGGEFWNFSFSSIFPPDSGWNYSGPNPDHPAFSVTIDGKVYNYPGYPGNVNNPSNVSAMQAAAKPGIVDSTPPTLNITSPANGSSVGSATATVSGNTTDNMAIHYVKWSNNRGGSGFAPMTWKATSCHCSSPYSWVWQMDWSANIPLQSGANIITVTSFDIKDLQATKTITINH